MDISTNDTVLSQHNESAINRYTMCQLVVIPTYSVVSNRLIVYKTLCSNLEKPTCPLGFSGVHSSCIP